MSRLVRSKACLRLKAEADQADAPLHVAKALPIVRLFDSKSTDDIDARVEERAFYQVEIENVTHAENYNRWFALEGDFFERIISAVYTARVCEGDQVIDVGANHGLHTVPLARCVGKRGRVIAIEALPHLAKALIESTRHLPQVKVINKAMSSEIGTTDFAWVKRDEGFSGMKQRQMPDELAADISFIRLTKSTIDRTVRKKWFGTNRVSFIKLDIEGAEYLALQGAKKIIAKHRPVIVFESGRQSAADLYGYTRHDFFGFFDNLDYDLFDRFGRPMAIDQWDRYDVPWYAIAAARGTEQIAFIRDVLPHIISQLETKPP